MCFVAENFITWKRKERAFRTVYPLVDAAFGMLIISIVVRDVMAERSIKPVENVFTLFYPTARQQTYAFSIIHLEH